jgi:ATP-dependent RNA helicase RhlE
MPFSALGLSNALSTTISLQGYTAPSDIQLEAIPVILSRRDMIAVAPTGTGKTAAFSLPLIQLLSGTQKPHPKSVRALIIVPTRELAAQVDHSIQIYSRETSIRSAAVFGGVRIEPQIAELQDGLDILVATPGRLIDLHKQQKLSLEQLEIVVLDEADRMLDLGFIEEIQQIHTLLPRNRQSLMFSATFSKAIKSLAKSMLSNPALVEVRPSPETVDSIQQRLYIVDKERKPKLLIHLIKNNKWPQSLVFSKTKHGADRLVSQLKSAGIKSASIHANRTQHARTLALEEFKNGSISVLVATDIASRGIDINSLSCVINFDLPYVAEDYIHRIGRTGRAENTGLALTLFSEDESKQLGSIERFTGRKFKREIIPGFQPSEKIIISSAEEDEYGNFEPDTQPKRRGKSIKNKSQNSRRHKK